MYMFIFMLIYAKDRSISPNSLPRFALVCEMFNFSLSKIKQKKTITNLYHKSEE